MNVLDGYYMKVNVYVSCLHVSIWSYFVFYLRVNVQFYML